MNQLPRRPRAVAIPLAIQPFSSAALVIAAAALTALAALASVLGR